MRKVLVIGGTRFFGKKLVKRLIRSGVDVTVLTRGQAPDEFGDAVRRLTVDRQDEDALHRALGNETYDVVYDNICYSAEQAEAAVRLFEGRAGRYIVTSSRSVYPFGGPAKREEEVDPYSYPLPDEYSKDTDYAEGKRLVEAVIFQKAPFPAAAVRFPVVLGNDDYTRRLLLHIELVQQGLPIGMPKPHAPVSFISSDEAADFLFWLGSSKLTGPVNACSKGVISPGGIVALIEEAVNRKASIVSLEDVPQEQHSPYGVPDDWHMDTNKAEEAGFAFGPLEAWLPALIRELAR
ncbi:NAD-dependent epimerase/dehydratase family protein [Cohnella sp. AR92]|uniref:NAD-dependent epimerase/dehydratase family protein n=1 Tax=Cohnella sp. AR92 TaxID=648716 RepID=UPI000F8E2F33|nr:NAD-dependent epimerase/dehydratase family protein [Cohnella sp. AR92]RUS48843.1 NAD-dependent epimerase/dehydratase family protein [Cohnella sp. AR92]